MADLSVTAAIELSAEDLQYLADLDYWKRRICGGIDLAGGPVFGRSHLEDALPLARMAVYLHDKARK